MADHTLTDRPIERRIVNISFGAAVWLLIAGSAGLVAEAVQRKGSISRKRSLAKSLIANLPAVCLSTGLFIYFDNHGQIADDPYVNGLQWAYLIVTLCGLMFSHALAFVVIISMWFHETSLDIYKRDQAVSGQTQPTSTVLCRDMHSIFHDPPPPSGSHTEALTKDLRILQIFHVDTWT